MAVDGTYDIEVNTPVGKMNPRLTLKTDGGSLSGRVEAPMGKEEFTGGTADGDSARWEAPFSTPLGKITLSFNAVVEGNEISGEVRAGNFGTFPFSGKRA